MKKCYRALTAQVVEKKWLGDTDKVPDGWHSAVETALAAFKPAAKPAPAPKAKRGKK